MNEVAKKEADRIMKIKGNVRGAVFYTHAAFIKEKEGEKGIELLENELAELGYPLRFNEVKTLAWYPEALSVLTIITAKRIFNWTEADIFEMGNLAPKYSFVVKLLMSYFISPKKCFQEAPKYWRKHYDFGELNSQEYDEDKKYCFIKFKGYKFHPLLCTFFRGYFLRIAQYVIQSKKITIKETKCVHKGDSFHEFLIEWE